MSNPLVMMNNTLALRPRGIRQAEVPPAIAGPSFKAPCHFYARGACQKGANCRFSHERATASAGETASEQSQEIAQKDSRAEIPCHFFAKGGCRSGDDCPFLHEQNDDGQNLAIAPPATTTSQEQSLDADKAETAKDDWTRSIAGGVAQFGDGASVVKITLPSDYSAVRLSVLPGDSTPSSVSALLAQLGFAVPERDIRIRPVVVGQGLTSRCDADVRVEDVGFSAALCGGGDNSLRRLARGKGAVLEAVRAASTKAWMPHAAAAGGTVLHTAAASGRVDCGKVHVSWHLPFRMAWLNFGSGGLAEKVRAGFETGRNTVAGRRVRTNPAVTGHGHQRTNHAAFTVALMDVPADASEADVVSTVRDTMRPRHVEMGPPSYDVDLGTANATVKSELLQFGPLEWWEDGGAGKVLSGPSPPDKRAKARARFIDESDAREAAAALNNSPLPFGAAAKLKLTVQLIYSARMKIAERIYLAVKPRIDAEARVWKAEHLWFYRYDPANGFRVLKVEGEDSKKVAAAKNTLEGIVQGETATSGDKVLWSPYLALSGGELYRSVQEMGKKLGVFVVRNKRLAQLLLYGPADRCAKAHMALADLVAAYEARAESYRIELSPRQFIWACRGGYKAVCSALPDASVSFDIASTPRRILISGSESDHKLALSLITDEHDASPLPDDDVGPNSQEPAPVGDCTICWTPADHAVITRCGHAFCADCFEGMCFAAVDAAAGVIRCAGDADRCGAVPGLDELAEHLASAALEELLRRAVAAHVRRNPVRFRYCPTPGCGHLYRAKEEAAAGAAAGGGDGGAGGGVGAAILTCAGCLAEVCTACHAIHPAMSCADHKDMSSGGYELLKKAKQALGVKDCPKCTTPIEKRDGCDHMTCGACHIHFCWKCLATFQNSESCYEHLNKEHGSIGIDVDDF